MGDEEGKDSLNLVTYPSLFIDRDFFFKPKDKHLNQNTRERHLTIRLGALKMFVLPLPIERMFRVRPS